MIKIERTVTVAVIAESSSRIYIDKFIDMLRNAEPYIRSPFGAATWRHYSTFGEFCLTTFCPNVIDPPAGYPKLVINSDEWIATGEYQGVKGKWYLQRTPNSIVAPYMR